MSQHPVPRTAPHLSVPGAPRRATKHYHHGRTPAAWAGAVLAFVGILVGGVALVLSPINWVVFAIGAVLLVLGGVVALALNRLGLGAD